jgi:hypothetical protein
MATPNIPRALERYERDVEILKAWLGQYAP